MPIGENPPPQQPPSSSSSIPWQQRVIDEEAALADKLQKLLTFIDSPSFMNCSGQEQILLQEQREAMRLYDSILLRRIQGFNLGEDAQQGQ